MQTLPQIGQIVKVLRGKDEGGYAIVIGVVDERFAIIADGFKRKFDQPKRKNLLHLELQPDVSSEVADSMRETGRVTNGKLRFAIQKYIERKGE
ncbi:KOW domain-containing RNA-binding protein [Paenibacillus abyssi]|uniref:50S ribosomal protein L14 n=1 Tax=Paenibacillus abyssi TaxID=1340531 RepID=A0A917FVP2_9BACL|nr:KOW domain-containing RNA-binding protein [Paenibacillus abyssi]GGG07228.1 50S ribosomal protein L14 [Paenibacillus abyssi]